MNKTAHLPFFPLLEGIVRTGHIVYIARQKEEKKAIEYWREQGFEVRRSLLTEKGTRHTSFIHTSSGEGSDAHSLDLESNSDPTSPLNRFLDEQGTYEDEQGIPLPCVPHRALYDVDPELKFVNVRNTLEREYKVTFMGGILGYVDYQGAGINQLIVAPERAFGPCNELVQHQLGRKGQILERATSALIDNFYTAYGRYSKHLLKQRTSNPD